MKLNNYKDWKKEELKQEIRKIELKLMESHCAKQTTKKENRTSLRKEIARIKTVLKQNENINI